MPPVALQHVCKAYDGGGGIEDISLQIDSGKFLTLLGPSGCGKSTTLRVIAGLVPPDSGRVHLGARDVTQVPVWRRNVGVMFQSLALFPHMTAKENVGFGLRMRKMPREDIAAKTRRALEMVRLPEFGDRYPHQMSGGQQQRVALARALVVNPDVLLLDEPFGALDRKLREAMQTEIHELTRDMGITSIFVTHDQEEALILSDFIAVMTLGRIVQFGTPNEIYERPSSTVVADFMGISNIFKARVVEINPVGVKLESGGLVFTLPVTANVTAGDEVSIALRPEHVELSNQPFQEPASVHGVITTATYHGGISSYELTFPDGQGKLHVRESNPPDTFELRFGPGARVWARWKPEALHVLRT